MVSYILIRGNILEADEQYIVHQTNCLTHKGLGLSKAIFTAFPHADVYSDGTIRRPGTILVRGDGKTQRFVINLFGQRRPGRATASEPASVREQWFRDGLNDINKLEGLTSIAFPYGVGCGLAGGSWNHYEKILNEFADKVEAKVVVYRL
jgi:O-acetyl-ADP-ribose deacetylase (regulator of RNase III)